MNATVNQVIALPAPTNVNHVIFQGGKEPAPTSLPFIMLTPWKLIAVEDDQKTLWVCKGPHCIKTFKWLDAHECMLTNARKRKWGVRVYPSYTSCRINDETLLHVLGLCAWNLGLIRLVPSKYIYIFFSFDCMDWILDNLSKHRIGDSNDRW